VTDVQIVFVSAYATHYITEPLRL